MSLLLCRRFSRTTVIRGVYLFLMCCSMLCAILTISTQAAPLHASNTTESDHDILIAETAPPATIEEEVPLASNSVEGHTLAEYHTKVHYAKEDNVLMTPIELTHEEKRRRTKWLYALADHCIRVSVYTFLSAIFAGLTLGVMCVDTFTLEIIAESGPAPENKYAATVLPLRRQGHKTLCTLIVSNMLCNVLIVEEFSAIFTLWHRIRAMTDPSLNSNTSTVALFDFLVSTTIIVLFAEIIPMAICKSKHSLMVAAAGSIFVRIAMIITYPVSFTLGKFLDWIIGTEETGQIYDRNELRKLMVLHYEREGKGEKMARSELNLMLAAMDFQESTVRDVMTPIDEVTYVRASDVITADFLERLWLSGRSRVPVESQPGVFTDVLLVKDLMTFTPNESSEPVTVSQVVTAKNRLLVIVAEDTKLPSVLKFFQEANTHMAIVFRETALSEEEQKQEELELQMLEEQKQQLQRHHDEEEEKGNGDATTTHRSRHKNKANNRVYSPRNKTNSRYTNTRNDNDSSGGSYSRNQSAVVNVSEPETAVNTAENSLTNHSMITSIVTTNNTNNNLEGPHPVSSAHRASSPMGYHSAHNRSSSPLHNLALLSGTSVYHPHQQQQQHYELHGESSTSVEYNINHESYTHMTTEVVGIVTMEDVVEALLHSEVYDEYDRYDPADHRPIKPHEHKPLPRLTSTLHINDLPPEPKKQPRVNFYSYFTHPEQNVPLTEAQVWAVVYYLGRTVSCFSCWPPGLIRLLLDECADEQLLPPPPTSMSNGNEASGSFSTPTSAHIPLVQQQQLQQQQLHLQTFPENNSSNSNNINVDTEQENSPYSTGNLPNLMHEQANLQDQSNHIDNSNGVSHSINASTFPLNASAVRSHETSFNSSPRIVNLGNMSPAALRGDHTVFLSLASDEKFILYAKGVHSEYFTLILGGSVNILVSDENFPSRLLSFNFVGEKALTTPFYVPDFSAIVTSPVRLYRISKVKYEKYLSYVSHEVHVAHRVRILSANSKREMNTRTVFQAAKGELSERNRLLSTQFEPSKKDEVEANNVQSEGDENEKTYGTFVSGAEKEQTSE